MRHPLILVRGTVVLQKWCLKQDLIFEVLSGIRLKTIRPTPVAYLTGVLKNYQNDGFVEMSDFAQVLKKFLFQVSSCPPCPRKEKRKALEQERYAIQVDLDRSKDQRNIEYFTNLMGLTEAKLAELDA